MDWLDPANAARKGRGHSRMWPSNLDTPVSASCEKYFKKIKLLIIDVIFISYISDHGVSGTMPFKMSILRNEWTQLKRPLISDNDASLHLFL